MKDYQNALNRRSDSSVIRSVVYSANESTEDAYANGMVLSYLDSLMSGNNN